MRHPRPDSIRLKRLQRYFLYAVLALLFFQRCGLDILELSGCVAGRFWNKRENLDDEDPWRVRDGDSGIDRHALERPCEIRMARGP